MGELVDQDQIATPGQHRRNPGVGQIARAEHAGGRRVLEPCQPQLQFGVERMVAGHEPRRAGADAMALDRRDGGGFQRRMLAQAEVVIAGERQQAAAVTFHPEIAGPAGRYKRAAQVGLLQRRKLLPCEFIEGGHVCTIVAPMDRKHWYEAGLDHVWLPYTQMKLARPPLVVARTEGCRIVLADGRELIDGIASWWTACHGYNHPHIRQAVERQLATMPHVMFGGLVHEQALTLARRLAALLPGDLDRVFFSESGSVAIEIAMKMAQQYWINRGEPKRNRFIAFKGGYHGDTVGAMAVSDPDAGMHDVFRGLVPEQVIVDLPTDAAGGDALELVLARHAESIAGLIVEPLVQGAGGMHFHDAATLQRLRTVADRCGALLIFDEIFTGFGRTGSMFG